MKMMYSELLEHLGVIQSSMTARSFEGVVPPHFFGEMAKTEFGRQTLHEKGHFPEFSLFIRQHGHENEDPELILKLKSILWTVVRRQP
jgi:rapamycin-insensitive companion of mTOR